jgi:hypothetical protein
MADEHEIDSKAPATVGKDLLNKDGTVTQLIEWATQSAASPEEIMDMFLEEGINVSHGQEITGDYVVVHGEEKPAWCTKHEGVRLFVVVWHFYESATGEFEASHIISPAGKFIVNDSSKGGMYGQLKKITDFRESQDPEAAAKRTSTAGLMVAGGLRRNKQFYYDTRPRSEKPGEEHFGRAISNVGLEDAEKYPMKFRELAKPTWSFDL